MKVSIYTVLRKLYRDWLFGGIFRRTEYMFKDKHGGKSKGTTCVVDRDVTAYMVVDRVVRFPTE